MRPLSQVDQARQGSGSSPVHAHITRDLREGSQRPGQVEDDLGKGIESCNHWLSLPEIIIVLH